MGLFKKKKQFNFNDRMKELSKEVINLDKKKSYSNLPSSMGIEKEY